MECDPQTHRTLAIDANNSTWEILGKPVADISTDEAEEMTRRAYAAAYHWQRAEGAGPANAARADWLLSRVWSVRAQGGLALIHAQRCLETCTSAALVDFDLAYAHEAMARAYACLGSADECRRHLAVAKAISINDPEDKKIVDSDLASEPWFGVSID